MRSETHLRGLTNQGQVLIYDILAVPGLWDRFHDPIFGTVFGAFFWSDFDTIFGKFLAQLFGYFVGRF